VRITLSTAPPKASSTWDPKVLSVFDGLAAEPLAKPALSN
jgi:hypothetical protein